MSIQSGTGDFYTRITNDKGIQIKNGRDGDDTWTNKPLSNGKWLNISLVHRNASSISVYVNGITEDVRNLAYLFFGHEEVLSIYRQHSIY